MDEKPFQWKVMEIWHEPDGDVLFYDKPETLFCSGVLYFDSLWTQNHSKFPSLDYLESHLCGPYRQTKAVKGMMGLELPLDMYSSDKVDRIKRDPKTQSCQIFC